MQKIKTLIITGANNHDWQRSSVFCRVLLENSGEFEVDSAAEPSPVLENERRISGYNLFFIDYNGPEWTGKAKNNFERAIHSGAGLVVLHASNNAFPGWTEYEKMVGLLWRDGTGHGKFHEFHVKIKDKNHPITRGMKDFTIRDELYHNLVHLHGVPVRVLASAYSDPDMRGTGKEEPVMAVGRYGSGRVYHHVLGHVWPGDPEGEYEGAKMVAYENPGFQEALIRGCLWAAGIIDNG